jgi:hypothetical protein
MATNTYVALDLKTVSSAVSSITFTDISSAYTDLVIVSSVNSDRSAGALDSLAIRFNGDTTSNYSYTLIQANTSSGVTQGRSGSASNIFVGNIAAQSASNNFSANVFQVMNYSNASTFKTVLARGGAIVSGNPDTEFVCGTWRKSPEAITSITVFSETGSNFNTGSTFALYGITREGVLPVAKATGGTIYSDSTYYYHVFGASGTFTPSQSITADVLCVAGGGGGGTANRGGGGGAGGIIYFAGQSLTATNHTITVGAGGNQFGQGNNSQFASLTVASGGGRGGASNFGGAYLASAGGSGGGNGNDGTNNGGASNQSSSGATAIYGNRGGNVTVGGDAAGGGGAGAAGTDGINTNNGIAGGIGTTAFSSWSSATGLGHFANGDYHLAAGGAGGANFSGGGALYDIRTAGGGGFNSTTQTNANGMPTTGSGGAGFSYNSGTSTHPAGFGGSGLIVVRYAK